VPINLSYQEAIHSSLIFKSFDKDHDRHISIHDLWNALKDREVKVSGEKLQDFITEVEINKNLRRRRSFFGLVFDLFFILEACKK